MGSVVLIHGALHGSWCWERVVDELTAKGVRAIAPDLPFTGLADDIVAARQVIEDAGADVVVCGHSYGGMVMSAAARSATNVNRLVYLTALMTDTGESVGQLLQDHPTGSALDVRTIDGKLTFDLEQLHDFFYEDSDPSTTGDIASRLRPMAVENWALDEAPAWKTIPSTYVICTHDRAIAPSLQRQMATRAESVVEWDSDHSPFLTRPGDIANLLAGYAARSPERS